MFQFVSSLIHFRKRHPILRKKHFLTDEDIVWHGHNHNHPEWKPHSRFIAFMLKDKHPLYVAFNADFHPAHVSLPTLTENQSWKQIVNTKESWDCHYLNELDQGPDIGLSLKWFPTPLLSLKPILEIKIDPIQVLEEAALLATFCCNIKGIS